MFHLYLLMLNFCHYILNVPSKNMMTSFKEVLLMKKIWSNFFISLRKFFLPSFKYLRTFIFSLSLPYLSSFVWNPCFLFPFEQFYRLNVRKHFRDSILQSKTQIWPYNLVKQFYGGLVSGTSQFFATSHLPQKMTRF